MSISTLLVRPGTILDLALQDIQAGPRQTAGGGEDKIRKYAGEFEASLLANLYKDMQHGLGGLPADEDPGADTFTDMGIQALAAGLVAGGGIGIAKLLIQNLIPKAAASGAKKAP